jgi:EAL domain-containing protein (putative c-di-GMP-specific phosphodiesterase class I)
MIAAGRILGIHVIAEGIESSSHLEHLRDLGCELGQGYFLSHPLAAELVEEMLSAQAKNVRIEAPSNDRSNLVNFGRPRQ